MKQLKLRIEPKNKTAIATAAIAQLEMKEKEKRKAAEQRNTQMGYTTGLRLKNVQPLHIR